MKFGMSRLHVLTILACVLILGGSTGLASAKVPTRNHVAAKKKGTPTKCAKRVKASGTVKYSDWQFPNTLNPYQASASVDAEVYDAMIRPLVAYNAKSHLYADLAAVVPTIKNKGIQNGGRTVVIHLRPGSRWSNGTEITSRDIKFGWNIDMNPVTGPLCKGTCDVIQRIDTPTKYEAVLHLKQVFSAAVPVALPDVWPHVWPGVWSTPAEAAQKLAQDQSFNFEGAKYPTDGPYQVAGFYQNDHVVLHPMKYYSVLSCGAAVQNLIFAFYASKPTMLAAAASDATDITTNYTPADLNQLHASHTFKTYSIPSYNYEHLEFNVDPTFNGAPNPLHNTKVRQAVDLAIDKLGLIQSSLGINAKAANGIVAWTPWINTSSMVIPFADRAIKGQWDPIVKKYVIPGRGRAITDARKLLAQTPWKKGFSVVFTTTSGNPVRDQEESVTAAGLLKVGIKVVPTFVPASKFFADYPTGGTNHTGAFQITMFQSTLTPDFVDIKYRLQSQYIDREQKIKSAVNYNYSGIHDRIFNHDLTAASLTYNKKLRTRYYDAVQVELNHQAYWDPFYFVPFISTVDSRVKNYNPGATNFTWNMYQWRAAGNR